MDLKVQNGCASCCVNLQSQSIKRLQSHIHEPKHMAATDDVAKDCRAKQFLGKLIPIGPSILQERRGDHICHMRVLLHTSIGLSDTRKPWRAKWHRSAPGRRLLAFLSLLQSIPKAHSRSGGLHYEGGTVT